jgi:cell shape-determining protein MreC
MTGKVKTKVKWGLVILGIVLVLGITAYFSKASILSHYQKFVDDTVAERTLEIQSAYNEQAKAYQEQIYNKQLEINKKDALLKVKEKKIKESEVKVTALQTENAKLQRLLNSIVLPVTSDETRKRLKELGYEVCK